MSGLQTLKARYVFPGVGDPIANGTVSIEAGQVVRVGKPPAIGRVEDLGNVAILPGLVNAHTHLDLSGLAQPLGEPGMGMADWIRRVIAYRRGRSEEDLATAFRQGVEESLRCGTAVLGDITAPSGTPAQAIAPALDVTLFLELIAPTAARVGPALEQAQSHWARQASLRPWRTGLSPHAPYTVRPDLLAAVARFSAQHALPLAFHLAESAEEMQLLESGDGPLRDLLVELGAWQPGLIVPSARPVDDYLKQLSVAYRALVIHGNYLDDEAIALLHRARDRMSVVYCPRTHARFGHCRYRLEALLAAGVTVALGTDSRASSPDLSVLAEMRWLARAYPQLGRDVVLHMGTIWGARALGREQHRGTLEPGKRADLVAIRLPERDAADPYALWLDTDLPLATAWISGRVVYNSSSPI